MATTIELIDELAEIMLVRDKALALFEDAMDPEDEDTHMRVYEAAEKRLEEWMQQDVPGKIAALYGYANRCKADAKWRKEEAARWSESSKSLVRRSGWVMGKAHSLLLAQREVSGQDTVGLPGGLVAKIRQYKSESVQVEDVLLLPSSMTRVKVEPDKTRIKKALKAGQEVAGAELVSKVSERVTIVEGITCSRPQ